VLDPLRLTPAEVGMFVAEAEGLLALEHSL